LNRLVLACCAAIALAGVAGCAQAKDGATAQAPAGTVPLTITAGRKTIRFNVEVARTPEEQQRGLMFRTSIAPDGGMIFPMVPPRVAKFWMKNCPVPQDWLFIRSDGSIAQLIENTVPYSLDPQGPDEPVAAVLEIAGGRAAELGITEDSKVSWQG